MAKSNINLASLFGNVAQELIKNQSTLNQADTQNNDHGDNMVNVFNTITQALQDKPKASTSTQLEYASDQVRQNCQSGSGTVYADGLARAATELQGQTLNKDNAMQLITALLGSGSGTQASSQTGESDPLSGLLGSLLGGTAQQQAGASSNPTTDALSSLLGGLLGGEQTPAQSGTGSGIRLDQILAAGMEFMQSQQQGQDTMSSLLDAVVAGSQAGSGYRAESGKLVAGTLMQGLGALLGKK
jgi:hypothetical protein